MHELNESLRASHSPLLVGLHQLAPVIRRIQMHPALVLLCLYKSVFLKDFALDIFSLSWYGISNYDEVLIQHCSMKIFKMLPINILLLFAFYVCALEPPFSPAVVQKLDQLSTLPSLINASQLLAGLTPAELAALFASASIDTTNNSQPNPIAKTFPNMTTGTINGSFVVLPLDYSVARAIVPSKYGILKQSIEAVLPFFPKDKYPVRDTESPYKQHPI